MLRRVDQLVDLGALDLPTDKNSPHLHRRLPGHAT
jgi:hypothetical protein